MPLSVTTGATTYASEIEANDLLLSEYEHIVDTMVAFSKYTNVPLAITVDTFAMMFLTGQRERLDDDDVYALNYDKKTTRILLWGNNKIIAETVTNDEAVQHFLTIHNDF